MTETNGHKTYRDVLIFAQVAQNWLKENPQRTKLAYALDRLLVQVRKIETKAQEALSEIDLEYCATDESGVVKQDYNGNLSFERDAMRERNEKRRAYFDRGQFELEPFFVPVNPGQVTVFELSVFVGVVITAETEAEIIRELESAPVEAPPPAALIASAMQ
jgi:hypothetical protein